MLKLQSVYGIMNTISLMPCWRCRLTRLCYYSSKKSKDDFRKVIVSREYTETWKNIQILAKERGGVLRNDSVNEIFGVARKGKRRLRRENSMNMKIPTRFTIEEGNANKKAKSLMGNYSFLSKKDDDDDVDNLKRDKYGRYVLDSKETSHESKKEKGGKKDYVDDNDNYKRDKYGRYFLDHEITSGKGNKYIKSGKKDGNDDGGYNNYRLDARNNYRLDEYGRFVRDSKETSDKRNKYLSADKRFPTKKDNMDSEDDVRKYRYDKSGRHDSDESSHDGNRELRRGKKVAIKRDDKKHGKMSGQVNRKQKFQGVSNSSFPAKVNTKDKKSENLKKEKYKSSEFIMQLMARQKEVPFIFSHGEVTHSPETDALLKDLTRKLTETVHARCSFSGLGVNSHFVELLTANKILKPTRVQAESIPTLLEGKSAIIESPTGSGKTLAFLLPLLQNLAVQPCSHLIIVPTRELATQIYNEAFKYGMDERVVSRHVSGVAEVHDKKLTHVFKDSRILIGTPKTMLEVIESNTDHFRQVRTVVIDEVDKLLPRPWSRSPNINKVKPTEKILAMIIYHRKNVQMVATSATISEPLIKELRDMGFTNKAKTINLIPEEFKRGKVPENIKHWFTIVPDLESSRIRLIGRLFEQSEEKSILVFIHQDESVEKVVDEFKEMGLVARALYKELKVPSPHGYGKFLKEFEDGVVQIVVSNSLTVRGLDFPFLNKIYLTFVPDTAVEYLHLAGRTGRMGQPAHVITLLSDSYIKGDKKHLKQRFSGLGVKGKQLKLSI